MGKKGGGGSQTVVEKNDPPAIVAPYLAELYPQTSNWFNSGQQGYYPGANVANVNQGLSGGLWGTVQRGLAGSPVNRQAGQTVQQLMGDSGGGYSPVLNGSFLSNNSWARGDGLGNNPWANGTMGASNRYAAGAGLAGNRTAQGGFLTADSNPYMRGMADAATRSIKEDFMESIAPSLASQFSAAGRTGSGAHVGAFGAATSKLGQRLGDVTSNLYGNAYQMERGLMEQAGEAERSRMYGSYEGERARHASSWAAERDKQYDSTTRDRDYYFRALGSANDNRLRAAALAPAIAQTDLQDLQAATQAGAQIYDIDQSRIDADRERFDYNRDAPLQRLMAYSSILSGATPYMSSSQSTSSAQKYNRLSGTIGGGLGGYALGSAIPMIGGPMGALLGGAMGLFG